MGIISKRDRRRPFGKCSHCGEQRKLETSLFCTPCYFKPGVRKQSKTRGCNGPENIIGQIFGLLTVIRLAKRREKYGARLWLCRCSCSSNKLIAATRSRLISGNTTSCGCRKNSGDERRTHGQSGYNKTVIYSRWLGIKDRCLNPNNERFADYGGRGITICKEWAESFVAFRDALGPPPSPQHSVGRIDNDKGYEPGNVEWQTDLEQAASKRGVRLITFNGETKTLSQWAQSVGINHRILSRRLQRGMPISKALQAIDHRRRPGAKSQIRGPYYERLAFRMMQKRCNDPNDEEYFRYGAAGIIVCDRWSGEEGFGNFLADMGPRPSSKHSLDRFPDKNGNYEPGNCRWATAKEQARNLRSNRILEFRGESLPLAEWSERTGFSSSLIFSRLKRGWSVERALTTDRPPRSRSRI